MAADIAEEAKLTVSGQEEAYGAPDGRSHSTAWGISNVCESLCHVDVHVPNGHLEGADPQRKK